MKVLSLFDGISCGMVALKRAGIPVAKYYASEIKSIATKVSNKNYPKIIRLGNILDINGSDLPKIDLLIGGSPCQDLSGLKADTRQNLKGEKSKLFFEYLRILKEVNPTYFLLENVKMAKDSQDQISLLLGVHPIRINSNLVSYQNRDRLYWTNIPEITQPKDLNISFQDNKSVNDLEKYKVNKTPSRIKMWDYQCPNITDRKKINCLTRKQDRWANAGLIEYQDFCRYLTVEECEKAQTLPVGYTNCLTKNQSYDVLGDGWTVDVIAHILSHMKEV